MHPVVFHIGRLPIHWYGVMMALGFVAGFANWLWLGRRGGRGSAFCSDLLFWTMLSGVIGARLAHVASDLPYYLAHPVRILRVDQGGLAYYGGFAGGVIGILLFGRARGETPGRLGDFVVTSLPLGHAFGRVGCFLNGCCHGTVHDGLLAVRYPAESLAWYEQLDRGMITRLDLRSLPVHPVQLYEAAFNLFLYGVLVWAYRRRTRNGRVLALYLLTYPAARFLLECLRGDARMHLGPLSMAQWVSLAGLAAGLIVWTRAGSDRHADPGIGT